LLQRGKVVAADALLGRFLPRLGPLVATQAASFFALTLFAAELARLACLGVSAAAFFSVQKGNCLIDI
jgi:hypothetical protein